jgi:hypothetical protein
MLQILNQVFLIPWTKFEPGMSVFIPCFDHRRHTKTLTTEAKRWGYTIVCKYVVEKGVFGLRVWRIK